MKRCSKCKELKEESQFYFHHKSICKSCLRKYSKDYYKKMKKEYLSKIKEI